MLVSDGSPIRHVGHQWVSNHACWSLIGLRLGMSVSYGSPIWHDGLQSVSVRSTMGLWSGMLVSDGSLIRHVGLQGVYDERFRSPVGLRSGMLVSHQACWFRWCMSVSNGTPIRHVGLWSGMSVSDWSPIRHVGLCMLHIFVNSLKIWYPTISLTWFWNHPDSGKLWKAKPCALNRWSEGLCTHQFLWMLNAAT